MATYRWAGTLAASALLVAVGCARTAPGTNPAASVQAPPVERQLLSLDAADVGDLAALTDNRASLPASIPAADADKLLVHIQDSDVAKAKPFTLQRHGHFGARSFGRFGGFGLWGGLGFYGGWPGLSSLAYSNLLYYPYGSYMYPYSLVGNAYLPFTYPSTYLDTVIDRIAPYSSVYPFLYRTRGLYRPYFLV